MPAMCSDRPPTQRTWKNMPAWQRKQFYRENERRRVLGKAELTKP
jgi:hypothetical protein